MLLDYLKTGLRPVVLGCYTDLRTDLHTDLLTDLLTVCIFDCTTVDINWFTFL